MPRTARRAPKPPPTNLSGLLDDIEARARSEGAGLSVDDLLDAVGRRSYGPLLLTIGVIAVSPITVIPGMTWLTAGLTLIVAAHLALGLRNLWLPKQALAARAPAPTLLGFIARVRPAARSIDRVLKPRLTFLTAPPFVNVAGLLCVAAALITFPLGLIPFAPLLPGLSIVAMGAGLVARDGVVLLLGGGAFAAAVYALTLVL